MYLEVNEQNVPSYMLIKNVIIEIEEANSQEHRALNTKKFKDKLDDKKIEEHIKILKDEIDKNYKEEYDAVLHLIRETINVLPKNIKPELSNMNNEVKKTITSYLYWKYRNKNNVNKDVNVNMQKIKRIFGFNINEKRENFIEPINLEYTCYKCNKIGIIKIYDYDLKYYTFKCSECGHMAIIDRNYYDDALLEFCECKYCVNKKEKRYKVFVENFEKMLIEINEEFLKEYMKIEDDKVPDEYEMRRDYGMYRNSISKDEREVLWFNPKNASEIPQIVKKIQDRDSKHNKKQTIYEELLSHRVLYIVRKKKSQKEEIKKMLYEQILQSFMNIEDNYNKVGNKKQYVDELCNKLRDVDIKEFYNVYLRKLKFRLNNIVIEFNYYKSFKIELDDIDFFENKGILNMNYIQEEVITEVNKTLVSNKILKSIFQSDAESSYFAILKNKYPQYIIIPNYRLAELIEVKEMSNFFSEHEIKYISSCKINYCILDKNGYLIKAIELQKGKHHNEKEWIWKDSVKKKVINMLGIAFEEVF